MTDNQQTPMSDATPRPAPCWWVALDRQPQGPHSSGYLLAMLRAGRIDLRTPVCPIDGSDWRPLSAYPELGGTAAQPGPPPLPPQLGGLRHLPAMTRAVTIYSIFLAPVLWVLGTSAAFVDWMTLNFDTDAAAAQVLVDLFRMLIHLAIVVAMIIGGIQLRAGKRSGLNILTITICLSLGGLALSVPVYLAIVIPAGDAMYSSEPSTGQWVFIAVAVLAGLGELGFQIAAIVHLIGHRRTLPLRD